MTIVPVLHHCCARLQCQGDSQCLRARREGPMAAACHDSKRMTSIRPSICMTSYLPSHQDLKPGETLLRCLAMARVQVRAVMMKVLTGCITLHATSADEGKPDRQGNANSLIALSISCRHNSGASALFIE